MSQQQQKKPLQQSPSSVAPNKPQQPQQQHGEKKKLDARIKTLIENCVKTRHRSFFVVVGNRAREQLVNLHYMLAKARVKTSPSILWCYKKDLGFIADAKSRNRTIIKKYGKQGDDEVQKHLNTPFNLFLSANDIRYCYFKETQNILGNTYGMLVLQDFEGITPNVLARTIETVEGGGMIVLLLPEMQSLKQLYTMTMDVHSRFRTGHDDVEITARFNERFLLSLASCKQCLVVDDQLNILPISSHIKDIKPVVLDEEERLENHILSTKEKELQDLKQKLQEHQPLGTLVSQAKSLDQGKAILKFVDAISEKTLQTTVALLASRGRGKSAALGLAIASAVSYGYSNIFVTSPSPENLKTLFEFIIKGLESLKYKDQQDFEIVQSTNPAFNNAVVRLNIFKNHRQTIQYIQPEDSQKLGQCELLVIDEAAAIPLPLVKKLLGPYLIYISSTINGYEGTGRSLSLKLLEQLKEKGQKQTGKLTSGARKYFEIKLEEPIRYGEGDNVERWLYDVLCLDATSAVPITSKCPHPSDCNLYYVNRDTLFSYNQASEAFLHNMMSLYVSSHYKNTPNDLQLMSDHPSHHLFVLLGPIDENSSSLPDIYCVIQVCMEGKINRQTVLANLSKGLNPGGDLIPYLVSRQYQESDFAALSGVRVVRIATHPEYKRMGYGTRALELLTKYYQNEIQNLDEVIEEEQTQQVTEVKPVGLAHEEIKPRSKNELPPLLQSLEERSPEPVHYMGVSYGMTQQLFNYWKKNGFAPVYIRLTPNELTGEHSCVMLKALTTTPPETRKWLDSFVEDFKRRFLSLLAYDFSNFNAALTLSILDYKMEDSVALGSKSLTVTEMDQYISKFDLKRLTSYSKNLVDYHMPFNLSFAQAAIMIGVGLQHKKIEDVGKDIDLQSNQILALFNKAVRKFVKYFKIIDKQRFVTNSSAPKNSKDDDDNDQTMNNDDENYVENDKGNVNFDELDKMDSDDEDEEKNKKPANKDILDLFEKPLEETDERFSTQKKRKTIAKEPQDEEPEKKKKKDDPKRKEFLQEVISKGEYKITGISEEDIERGVEESGGLTSSSISVGTDKSNTEPKEVKKYMLKSEKEIKQIEKQYQNKFFKKGGKKKRQVKH
ncbi:hypothetical protein FDP41_013173 [Naegleria fowleri]|uniref:RNA cytidine acetyltransferase n=1 Tax=Naegleria fowleri TaxID=5763 RepID=A0A6A5C4A2_NAEFO|nr:uncharacterized protein FDP41_013173 [Naegleria fowleri]KAF0980690.1 hypothetical protein FDP41_013173 [Naegleria fowleri]